MHEQETCIADLWLTMFMFCLFSLNFGGRNIVICGIVLENVSLVTQMRLLCSFMRLPPRFNKVDSVLDYKCKFVRTESLNLIVVCECIFLLCQFNIKIKRKHHHIEEEPNKFAWRMENLPTFENEDSLKSREFVNRRAILFISLSAKSWIRTFPVFFYVNQSCFNGNSYPLSFVCTFVILHPNSFISQTYLSS